MRQKLRLQRPRRGGEYLTAPRSTGHLYVVFEPGHLRAKWSYGTRWRPSSQACLVAFLALTAFTGCAHVREGSGRAAGISALAENETAQSELRALKSRYFALPRALRGRLTPELVALINRYPSDPSTEWARVYLAFNEVDAGRSQSGAALSVRVRGGTAGSVRDLATVALAASLTSEAKPTAALALLVPLQSKVIEADERELFYEEITRAALRARSYADAVQFGYEWVTSGSLLLPESNHSAVDRLVQAVPTPELQSALRRLEVSAVSAHTEASEVRARNWFLKALRQALIARALAKKDPILARWLLGATAARERLSDNTTELSRLATTGAPPKVRVIGRRLGLLLGAGTREARDRSASVVSGLLASLDLTSETLVSAVELKTETDTGAPGATLGALESLASDGVALVVAGIEPESAAVAASYAERERLPVLLLDTPAGASTSDYVFGMGADPEAVAKKLTEAAAQAGFAKTAGVGPGFVSCDAAPTENGVPVFPFEEWRQSKVEALLLLGDAVCSRQVVAGLAGLKPKPVLFLGLESSNLSGIPAGYRRVTLGAGKFPEGVAPGKSWFHVLGHDAGILGAEALLGLPASVLVEDRKEASRLHALARTALSRAKGELWSSDAHGFEASQKLPRTFRIE